MSEIKHGLQFTNAGTIVTIEQKGFHHPQGLVAFAYDGHQNGRSSEELQQQVYRQGRQYLHCEHNELVEETILSVYTAGDHNVMKERCRSPGLLHIHPLGHLTEGELYKTGGGCLVY